MQLRVHCPSGCLIRASYSRAGTCMRCSDCKAVIKLPEVSSSEIKSGKPIPVYATFAEMGANASYREMIAAEREQLLLDDSGELVITAADSTATNAEPEEVTEISAPDVADLSSLSSKTDHESNELKLAQQLPQTELSQSKNQLDLLINAPEPKLVANKRQHAKKKTEQPKTISSSSSLDEFKSAPTELTNTRNELEKTAKSDDQYRSAKRVQLTNQQQQFKQSDSTTFESTEQSQTVDQVQSIQQPTGADNTIDVNSDDITGHQPGASLHIPQPKKVSTFVNDPEQKRKEELVSALDFLDSIKPTSPFDILIATDQAAAESDELVVIQLDDDHQQRELQDNDHRFLTRFFSVCIFLLGLIAMTPAIVAWSNLIPGPEPASVARWIFLLVFMGALQNVYVIYLWQLPDYGALWACTVMLLVSACVYSVAAAALWIDNGVGVVTGFLQIPFTIKRNAAIWCIVMLSLSGLLSYLCGREAINWRRHEHWRNEIA